jgi:hypothetical protein
MELVTLPEREAIEGGAESRAVRRSRSPISRSKRRHERHVCRLLRLTCMAPDIVEAILDGRQPRGLRLAEMLGNAPLSWDAQRWAFGFLPTA